MSKHVLSVLVKNHAGVLSRVSGLFSRRGFNIDSLAVGITEQEDISRITIVVKGDDYTVDQVIKQLNKLIDVIEVRLLEKPSSVTRELVLLKVQSKPETRAEIIQITEIFRSNIVDVSHDSLTVEMTGGKTKINAFQDLLSKFGILEVVRTGLIAIGRGDNIVSAKK